MEIPRGQIFIQTQRGSTGLENIVRQYYFLIDRSYEKKQNSYFGFFQNIFSHKGTQHGIT